MATNEKKSIFSSLHNKNKRAMSEADRAELQMREMRRQQETRSLLRREEDYVRVEIDESGPFHIVHLSDIHFGAESVDYEYLDEVMRYILETPGVYVMFYGDLIEGFNKEYTDTNSANLLIPVEEQIIMLRERYLKPLHAAGKILSMVSRFTQSHEGWLLKQSNMDIYPLLTLDMSIPLVGNGGITEIVAKNDHVVRVRCFHNSPKGGNEMTPVSGLRNSEAPLPGYVDMVVAGDRHTLGGSHAMEKSPDGTITVYVQIAPFKGNINSPMPDRLMQAKNGNRKFAPGGSSTIHEKINGKPTIHSVRNLEEANNRERIRRLGDLLDADSAARDEIMAAIANKPEMTIQFNPDRSKKRVQDDERANQSYVKTTHDIYNADFLAAFIISGIRAGSKSRNKKKEQQFTDKVSRVSNEIVISGAENIDRTVVASPTREETVSGYIGMLNQLNWLVQLNDSTLRHEGWKKSVVREGTGYMAGTAIQEEGGAMLLDNEGEMFLVMRDQNGKIKQTWSGVLIDGTGGGAAPKDPYRMAVATELEKFGGENRSHDLVIGSRSSSAGVQSRFNPKTGDDQLFIAPGRIANESVVGGKGRSSRTAEGGLGAFLTIWGEAYPFMTLEEAEELNKDFPAFAHLMMNGTINSMIKGLERKGGKKRR